MARRWRALPVPCFSDCSWVECDVDRGRSEAIRNVLICFWRHIFQPYIPLYMSLRFGIIERRCDHIAIKRAIRGFFFFFFFSCLLS